MFALGLRGSSYLLLVALTHMAVDRWKVRATRRARGRRSEAAVAGTPAGRTATASGLGIAWTPWPGMLFLADQALHLTIALVGWLVLLYGVPLTAIWVDLS